MGFHLPGGPVLSPLVRPGGEGGGVYWNHKFPEPPASGLIRAGKLGRGDLNKNSLPMRYIYSEFHIKFQRDLQKPR